MHKKAVALLSGGLDSMLAVKLMLEQGIDVHGLNFLTVFCTCTSKGCRHQATKAAEELNIPVKVMNVTEEYMDIVKNPKYQRGRNMNPCIDCRIFTFKKARLFMEEIGASFVITGEVLGERPMSQRRDAILLIEKESGLRGLIVRPLCAKLFEPSLPEKVGIVNRDKLLDIEGRSRNRQISIANEIGINEYPCPAGGCLLTDRDFSNRLKDLLKYTPAYGITDLHLLKIGRQFRISESIKLYVGRDQAENEKILTFSKPGDYIFDTLDIPGPIGLARGGVLNSQEIYSIASIIARYSDATQNNMQISYCKLPSQELEYVIVDLCPDDKCLLSFRI